MSYNAIIIRNSLTFENRGTIIGNIFIDPAKEVWFRNSGQMNGVIDIARGAHLRQMVMTPNDMNHLDVTRAYAASFVIMADGARDIRFMDLVGLAKNADRIVIKNSVLDFNIGDVSPVPIELSGEIVLKIHDVTGLDDHVLLSDVFGDGVVFVQADIPNLFYTRTVRRGDDIVISVNRETDYVKIIGGDKGFFLNRVRRSGQAQKFMAELDSAQSGAEINSLMRRSAMFNPVKLMDPLKVLAKFAPAGGFANTGAGAKATALFGRDMSLYESGTSLEFSNGHFAFGLNASFGVFSGGRHWSDNAGVFYGGGAYATWTSGLVQIVSSVGFQFVDIDTTDPVFDGMDPVYKLSGITMHGAVEASVCLFDDIVYVHPVVRMNFWHAEMLDSKDTDIVVGDGVRIGRRTESMGIVVDYAAYGIIERNGGQFGMRADIDLGNDGMSVAVDIGALESDREWFYKIVASIRFVF